jgi:RND family efflux transporter MFP subunit
VSLSRAITTLLIFIVLLFGALGAVLTWRTNQQAESLNEAEVYTVTRRDLSSSIAASGIVTASEVTTLSPLLSGVIVEALVSVGDTVAVGAPLIRLDSREQFLIYNQANLNYELAMRQFEQVSSINPDEITLAEAQLAAAQSGYAGAANAVTPEMIAAAELELQQAQVAYDTAVAARQQADPGRQSPEAIQLLDAAVGEASFTLEIARLRLEELRNANNGALGVAGANIQVAQAQLDQVLAGPDPYVVQQAQIAVDEALLTLEQARLQYERTLITAPFAGTIAAINGEAGQRVSAGTPIVQMVVMDALSIRAEVDEIDLAAITPGMSAQVVLAALPDLTLPASVAQVDPAGREDAGITVYDVELRLQTADARIRPGMTANVAFVTQTRAAVLAIPDSFLQTERDSGRQFVTVLNEERLPERRNVQVGLRANGWVEITDGLEVGEQVVQP